MSNNLTKEQQEELIDILITYCNEDQAFLENRIDELIQLKPDMPNDGDEDFWDAVDEHIEACERTYFLKRCIEELIALNGDELYARYIEENEDDVPGSLSWKYLKRAFGKI